MSATASRCAVLGSVLFLVSTLATPAPAAERVRWEVDGQTREAIVHAPEEPADGPLPVVLAFHGFGDNAVNFQHTNLHRAWPEAVVVYFQGLTTRRGLPGWLVQPGDANRDLALVDAALVWLRETYDVDEARLYATGYSNGGMFTYLLWAERAEVFAAFAPVAARLRDAVEPTTPRPVFHVAGMADRVVDYRDQEAAIETAIAVNGVGGSSDGCGAGCTVHGVGGETPVRVWRHPGAHVYPRDTSERIVAFLREHRLDR